MSKIDLVRKEMMEAMKSKDKVRKEALSALLAALKAKAIDKREDLTEEEENSVVQREIKQLHETIETSPADRTEIIEQCKQQIAVLVEFAPQMMNTGEIEAVIQSVLDELGMEAPAPKDKGAIMKSLMPLVKGKADGKLVNELLGKRLGA